MGNPSVSLSFQGQFLLQSLRSKVWKLLYTVRATFCIHCHNFHNRFCCKIPFFSYKKSKSTDLILWEMRVSKGRKKGTSNCLASCAAQERKKGINDEWAAERVKKEKLEEKPFFGGEGRYGNGVCCWWREEENGRERNGVYRTVVRKLKSELLFQKRQNTKAYCGTTNTEKAAAGSSRSVW